jgi:protein-S-isoprenylcysteine O-methyltransferase Ste14
MWRWDKTMTKKEHHHRPDLIGEHRFGDAGQVLSFVLFTAAWMGDGLIFQPTNCLNDIIPLYVRLPLAVVAMGLSLYLAIKSMSMIFGEKRAKPEIVRKDIYARIRHPMYVSEILLYFGFLCMNMSLVAAGIYLIIIVFLYAICRYEEKLLIKHFGDEYRQYMKDVPMWFPRLKRKKQ